MELFDEPLWILADAEYLDRRKACGSAWRRGAQMAEVKFALCDAQLKYFFRDDGIQYRLHMKTWHEPRLKASTGPASQT